MFVKDKCCKKCKDVRPASDFHKSNSFEDGLSFYCKSCENQRSRLKYLKYKEKVLAGCKKYREKNKKKIQEYHKSHYITNKEIINKRHREYWKNYETSRIKRDLEYKLRKRLRSRLGKCIKRNSKNGSAVRDLGCTVVFLKKYLQSKFEIGMTWENYGKWHIDHIKPLSKFNLSKRDEFLKACHYSNLQPLWARDNIKKRDK